MPSLKFPHFIRRISARLPLRPVKYFLWLFLISIVMANLFANQLSGFDEEKHLRQAILINPADSNLHEKLGQYYLNLNRDAAQKEYSLAQLYYQSPSSSKMQVLGEKSSPWQTWTNIISYEEKIKEEIKNWEKLSTLFPDYTYIKMKLAVSYYLLGDAAKSHALMQKVLRENPVDDLVLKLAEELK